MKTWCPDCEEPRFHRPEGVMKLCLHHERAQQICRSDRAIDELNDRERVRKQIREDKELDKLLEEGDDEH